MNDKKLETVFTLEIVHDEIVESVRNDLLERSNKGKKEYGTTMDRNDLSEIDWLKHLYEEQLDSCIYIKKLITIKSK